MNLRLPALAIVLIGAIAGTAWLLHERSSSAPSSASTAPIPQDVYVWQRDWTPSVRDAVRQQSSAFHRLVVLAAEISLKRGDGQLTEIHPDYAALKDSINDIGLAIRIGPLPRSSAKAFDPASSQTALICSTAKRAIDAAHQSGMQVAELQLDFDCAESKLAGYENWVIAVQKSVAPTPVVITALPSWLKHAEFADLARRTGAFVLQVHSLHQPTGPNSPMTLCDPEEARQAVTDSGEIGVPFRVALPTYSYLAGFSPEGKLLGLSAEGPSPNWPAGTLLRMMRSDPDAIASLVSEWLTRPPAGLTGIIWYRLPVADDTMNWRPVTLHAVMAGRRPAPQISAESVRTQPGLIDIFLRNSGDADGSLQCEIRVQAAGAEMTAADGMGGFDRLDAPGGGVIFRAGQSIAGRWIAPGERIQVGWLRLSADKEVQTHVTPETPRSIAN